MIKLVKPNLRGRKKRGRNSHNVGYNFLSIRRGGDWLTSDVLGGLKEKKASREDTWERRGGWGGGRGGGGNEHRVRQRNALRGRPEENTCGGKNSKSLQANSCTKKKPPPQTKPLKNGGKICARQVQRSDTNWKRERKRPTRKTSKARKD